MLVLFVLGLLGLKAAAIILFLFKFVQWVSNKGNAIKRQHEEDLRLLRSENAMLKGLLRTNSPMMEKTGRPIFIQPAGKA